METNELKRECMGTECSGCFYENEWRIEKDNRKFANEEIEDLRKQLTETRCELETVKRAYCLIRKDLIAAQEKNAKLERDLADAKEGRNSEDTRAYVDFVARLRRIMLTAPAGLGE